MTLWLFLTGPCFGLLAIYVMVQLDKEGRRG